MMRCSTVPGGTTDEVSFKNSSIRLVASLRIFSAAKAKASPSVVVRCMTPSCKLETNFSQSPCSSSLGSNESGFSNASSILLAPAVPVVLDAAATGTFDTAAAAATTAVAVALLSCVRLADPSKISKFDKRPIPASISSRALPLAINNASTLTNAASGMGLLFFVFFGSVVSSGTCTSGFNLSFHRRRAWIQAGSSLSSSSSFLFWFDPGSLNWLNCSENMSRWVRRPTGPPTGATRGEVGTKAEHWRNGPALAAATTASGIITEQAQTPPIIVPAIRGRRGRVIADAATEGRVGDNEGIIGEALESEARAGGGQIADGRDCE
mmetsp:Transcript_30435/g.88990  ORF Transcript_30435/g.88990 Transcript_30435/m.88990 type:complete len:323 (+) Transcript_30435:69-1037(+)